MAVPVLELKHVNKSFCLDTVEVDALKDINLTIKQGELAAIIGPSCSGKSTLMYIMGFLDTPTSGQVIFEGRDVSKLTENQQAQIRNEKIGFVFQMFNLLTRTSALDNVLMPITYSKTDKAVARERALKLMERVGIAHRTTHFSNQMSGGEQQRVAITRAFINNPSLILADEPTGNLDSKTGE
jgi:putative ABC transport system ATP-binding protein